MKHEEWQWSDMLVTNQDTIDYQHKTLFRIINDLIRACNDSTDPNGLLVEVALDELLKYAGHHFSEEETLMQKHNYADFENHHTEHVEFVEVMKIFKQRFDKNEDIADELIAFMHRWLIKHIMTKDKEAMSHCI